MIYRLDDDDIRFPDPRFVPKEALEESGCLAAGGDLSPERLIHGYSWGIFPWSDYTIDDIYWYCPMQRFVIFPEKVHISHSMRTLMNKGTYTVTYDRDFEGVIRGCAEINGRLHEAGAWLGGKMLEAHLNLHKLGWAKSMEVWRDGQLVGGFYGEAFENAFIGESMFSLEPNTSKLALITLCQWADIYGYKMIDCQLRTPHLESLGGEFISYEEYLRILWGKEPPLPKGVSPQP